MIKYVILNSEIQDRLGNNLMTCDPNKPEQENMFKVKQNIKR